MPNSANSRPAAAETTGYVGAQGRLQDSLAAQAHRAVFDMIRTRQLPGGHVIVEAKLAEHLGVSRTPLREALQRLEGEGMVVKGSGRSFVVRTVDLTEYMHSLKLREILETEAGVMALGRIPPERLGAVRREIDDLHQSTRYHTDAHWRSDDNLHELYIAHCGNPVMTKVIRDLRVTTRLFEIARLADRLDPDNREHLEILEALASLDARRVRKAIQDHLKSLSRFALDQVR